LLIIKNLKRGEIFLFQNSSEAMLKSEMIRWKEKSLTLEESLRAKTEIANQQMKEILDLKQKQDSIELNSKDLQEVQYY
jgi:CII-binding regulator of phage lambda lysogenization HflD